ncbi:hypothetical protein RSSM_03666 [Rhodopirellula sallentina SM41]|uniref:Uncharacterized protein n=1 Tax=Rhodopirellula sallentina SM41 TaxID=1263870 RepID=M5UAL8_9BACT|nr:hypothetical protein RSSM_03666 [Rhodopirellula sallentina SM41]
MTFLSRHLSDSAIVDYRRVRTGHSIVFSHVVFSHASEKDSEWG